MNQILLLFTANVETRKNVCNSDVGDVFGRGREPLGVPARARSSV
jgi:hypothetical protein